MRTVLPIILLLSAGCVTIKPIPPTIDESKRVENSTLPEDPGSKVISVDGSSAEWAAGVADGECPEKGGILYSEPKAQRLELYKTDYKLLRKMYEADRSVWVSHRSLYETKLQLAGEELQRKQPNWFQSHAFEIGILTGAGVAAAIAVGIVYGVAPAFQQAK